MTVKVIVPSKEDSAALAEGDGCDAADDVLSTVTRHFLVGPDVKHATCRIVTARREVKTVRHEGDGVDV